MTNQPLILVHHLLKHSILLSFSLPFSNVLHFKLLKVAWHLVLCEDEIVKHPRVSGHWNACILGQSCEPRGTMVHQDHAPLSCST